MKKLEITAVDIAQRFLGMKEISGNMANPQIIAMLQLEDKSIQSDEVPWCSAFVNYIAWLLGLPRSKSLSARSWLTVGTPITIDEAEVGFDVVIFRRGTGNQPGADVIDAPGHVGFYAGKEGNLIVVLGGNQGDAVSEAKFKAENLLGIRRLL